MPCQDVTESIFVALDVNECLVDYELRKRTCGAEVGHPSLLLAPLLGRGVAELAALQPSEVLELAEARDEDAEFLCLKHFVALQEAVAALSGETSGRPDSACEISRISYEPDGRLELEGLLRVDLLTERIKACGNCRGCGRRETSAAASVA